MRIVILSRSRSVFSTQRLCEAAEKRNHIVSVVNPVGCYMNITSRQPLVHFRDQVLEADAVIPRIGRSITFYGTAVVRQFEMMGSFSLNESVAIARSRDKLRSLQLLAKKGVGLPVTGFAHSTHMTQDLIKLVGGPPLIIKLLDGSQGSIVMAETHKAAESVVDAFRNLDAHFLVQEYIKDPDATEIRCIVIGDKVVASMSHGSRQSERSTGASSEKPEVIKISPEERSTAVLACSTLGLNVAGVDIIRSNRGPLVLEVNSSPDLRDIERATGKNVASLMIEYLEKHAVRGKTRTKGRG